MGLAKLYANINTCLPWLIIHRITQYQAPPILIHRITHILIIYLSYLFTKYYSIFLIIIYCWRMIIDEVIWNVIKNKHCSFRIKYPFFHVGPSLKTSAGISITWQASATAGHVPWPTPSTPPSDNKKESAISTWRLPKEHTCPANSGKRWGSTNLTRRPCWK